ncbi:MAG: response regulator [Ignavibacteriales bacterium]|nr:response regulator [Ignavibacteriales bacterium]
MKKPLRILHVEDNERDADLIQSLLVHEGFEPNIKRVDSRDGFINELSRGEFDIVLCDYNLPSFDGKSALVLAKEQRPEIPFIFVSGTIGEERAIDALKRGATDYVIKDRLERLIPAVQRAVREAEEKAVRKSLEEQLFHAQRMESIGTLAGGIAHDFNNILGIIMGHASLLEKIRTDPIKFSDSTQVILQATRRGAMLVRQLLTFARKNEVVVETVHINDVVTEVVKLLKGTFSKSITLTAVKENDLPTIAGDATQIQQILLNLCVNARDAMPNGGTLTITTEKIHGNRLRNTFLKAMDTDYVRIKVSDTGTGMSAETRKRIFEPFYTTKDPGKGTGLGLAVTFGIVEIHNGFIDVESELGKGTTFSIYFPGSQAATIPGEDENSGTDDSLNGTEILLIIEDEEILRELLTHALAAHGYKILSAADAEEGVMMYKQNAEKIDLVISDFGLPKFDGFEVLKRLKAINLDIKFILASGYIEPEQRSMFMSEGAREIIQKPYDPQKFLSVIRKVLDE